MHTQTQTHAHDTLCAFITIFLSSFSVKKQPENEYDYISHKPRAVRSDHKTVTMDKNPAYQSTVLANKTTDDHPSEYEIINLSDDVKMEKNPAYAETHFK